MKTTEYSRVLREVRTMWEEGCFDARWLDKQIAKAEQNGDALLAACKAAALCFSGDLQWWAERADCGLSEKQIREDIVGYLRNAIAQAEGYDDLDLADEMDAASDAEGGA